MKVGDRVIAKYPDQSDKEVGEIIEGPVFRNNKVTFKVRYDELENWIPADWLSPFIGLRVVDQEDK